ncbi:MAG: hypothetical protein ACD_76C00055G0005 [uncultured bacterium]|nr:MAG: hypothetical protein ACD_76C00055G0005 [uncultured bacterium]HBD05650.1 hypothetical protein [Candidatus Uhrbacteria bacterium]
MTKLFFVASALLLLGSGCAIQQQNANQYQQGNDQPSNGQPVSIPPSVQCPDVCSAICAGLPEPELPVNCPVPMCSCEPSLSLGDMKVCQSDSDCVYADRSVCPFTEHKNIDAINKKYVEEYMAAQPDTTGIFCIELYASYEQNPKCIQNTCRTPNEF